MTSVGPTRFERRISLRTTLRSTARRGGACREAKDCCGVDVYSRCMSDPWMGRSAKTLWATSPTVRQMRLLDEHPKRDDSSRPSSDGPVVGDQLTCGAFESSYYRVRSAVPRHCVVTHKQGTTTARIIARDLSENKTLRNSCGARASNS